MSNSEPIPSPPVNLDHLTQAESLDVKIKTPASRKSLLLDSGVRKLKFATEADIVKRL